MPKFREPPLQPLRLPSRWVVQFNTFYEVDARFRSWDDTSSNFKEDMLLLRNLDVPVLVDLGWVPSFRSTGRFCLRAIRVQAKDGSDWDKPLRELTTRSRRKVVAALEEWVVWYSANGLRASRGKKKT